MKSKHYFKVLNEVIMQVLKKFISKEISASNINFAPRTL